MKLPKELMPVTIIIGMLIIMITGWTAMIKLVF